MTLDGLSFGGLSFGVLSFGVLSFGALSLVTNARQVSENKWLLVVWRLNNSPSGLFLNRSKVKGVG